MGHIPSKMPSVQGYLQQLAVAAAALLPGASLQARKEEQLLLSILNNSVISEKILSHLTVRDMKAASQVNSTFCRMVQGSLCFREKVVLVVPKDAVGVEEILENTSLTCVEGVVDLSASSRTVQLLSEITWELIIRTESKTNFWLRMERLAKLLKYSPELKLKTLYVDIRELEEFSKVVSDLVEFTDVMTNSECLYISDSRLKETYDDIASSNWVIIHYDPVALMDLKPTSDTSRSHKLTSFVCHIMVDYSHPVVLEVIEEILKRHKGALQRFWCNYNKTWTLDFMKAMKIPLLEVLFVEVKAADEQMFIEFLEGLESLRDLEVSTVDGKLSKSLVAAIKKRSAKLTRLHIYAEDFSEVCTKDDWSFLRSMELLKDFRIKVWGKGSCEEELIVVSSLPPNQLSDLIVAGSCTAWEGDDNFELQNNHYLDSYHLWMSSWKGLQCLRKLTLACCFNSIDDNFVQMILRECKELQELEMEDIHELTVKGFTGINNESDCKGISVKDHQNLRHLSIRDCRKIQPNDLVSTDAFRNLKSLEYIPYVPVGDPLATIPDDIISLLILKNPCLETICVPLKSDDSAERIMGNVEAYNHPLRKVINRIS